MYSEQLLRWKREHLRVLANAGAPDRAGIRGETWRESASKPVAFFRIRRDPWNPPVAREAPAVRRLILQAFGDMIQHAELREKVILRLLLETGARLGEVLQLSAGGYRRGRSMLVGVSALLRDKGSLGIENKPVRILPETEALLQRYIRGERARRSAWSIEAGGVGGRRSDLPFATRNGTHRQRLPRTLAPASATDRPTPQGRSCPTRRRRARGGLRPRAVTAPPPASHPPRKRDGAVLTHR